MSEKGPTEARLAPEDFYYDGEFLVFTSAFHLRRGYCCESGCRHCPYRQSGAGEGQQLSRNEESK